MNNQRMACDPERIELFLQQQLSDEEQTAFELHLDECSDCRRRLEAAAAGADVWAGVRDSLSGRPLQADAPRSDDATFDSAAGGDAPAGHATVLELLAPTDDDRMLGRLGTYEVMGVIGSGGMGVVLKAFDAALHRYVAIKVLAPHLGSSGAARKRFAREAQAAAAVVHDNVMEIYGVADVNGLPYLVMPYVRGQSLQRRLDAQGPLALVEILRIGTQVAAGLAAAHAQWLVHRDVKPANILLADGVERVKLTDFGLARAADDASLTKTGVIAGTPQYMSPEQARGDSVDQRSDLFSLGSVLYAMCTGHAPFRAETSYGVLRRITDQEPRPIRQLNPDIPPWLCQIIAKLMSKQPGDRFESAREVAELLEQCLAHVQQPTAVALPASLAPRSRGHRWSNSRRLGVSAMIAAGLCALGMFVWQSTDPPQIAGRWTGEGWGQVVLREQKPGAYEGTYDGASGAESGKLTLQWSRVQRRFNGTWTDAKDRSGRISVRLVDGEICGAWTTTKAPGVDPGTPELADLSWRRPADTVTRPDKTVAGEDRKRESRDAGLPATPLPEPQPKTTTAAPQRINHLPAVTTGNGVAIACSADGRLIAVANGNPTRIMMGSGRSRVEDWQPSVDILNAETGKTVVSPKLTTAAEDAVLAATERVSDTEATVTAFSPDGKLVAVGTSIGQVKLFNAWTGELLRSLDDEKAKLADEKTPENWKSLRRAMGSVASLAFSPDGSLLATCGSSFADFSERFDGMSRMGFRTTGPGRLKLWDVQTGALKHDLVGHNDQAYAVAFSPDGRWLASAGRWLKDHDWGNGVIVWNPQTGQAIHSLIRTTANAGTRAIAFSPDSKLLVMGTQRFDDSKTENSSSGGVSLIRVSSAIEEWLVTVPGWAKPVAFSRDGKSVAVLCGGRSIRFLDVSTGAMTHEIQPAESQDVRWYDFAMASQGHLLAIGTVDNKRTGRAQRAVGVEVWSTGSSDNGNAPASPAQGKTTTGKSKPVDHFATTASIGTIACSADGRLIATANGGPTLLMQGSGRSRPRDDWKPSVDILDARTGKTVVSPKLTTADEDAVLTATERLSHFEVKALAFSPEGSVVAVGTSVGQVKLFNSRTGELVRALDDEKARLADKKAPENWRSLERALGSVASLAFSPDGSLLAVCGGSFGDFSRVFDSAERSDELGTGPGRLKVWEVKAGTLKHDLVGHSHANAVAFSPDGKWLASAGRWLNDSQSATGVILWNPQTGAKHLTVSREANGGTDAVGFSPDSKEVVISSVIFDKDQVNDAGKRAISVAHVVSGVVKWQRTFHGVAKPVAFFPGGDDSIVVLHGGRSIWFIDPRTGELLASIVPQAADPQRKVRWCDFALAKRGRMMVIGGVDDERKGNVNVWDFHSPDAADG